MAKKDSIICGNNNNPKTPPPFTNKEYYIGSTSEKTRESEYSPSDNDFCAINLVE